MTVVLQPVVFDYVDFVKKHPQKNPRGVVYAFAKGDAVDMLLSAGAVEGRAFRNESIRGTRSYKDIDVHTFQRLAGETYGLEVFSVGADLSCQRVYPVPRSIPQGCLVDVTHNYFFGFTPPTIDDVLSVERAGAEFLVLSPEYVIAKKLNSMRFDAADQHDVTKLAQRIELDMDRLEVLARKGTLGALLTRDELSGLAGGMPLDFYDRMRTQMRSYDLLSDPVNVSDEVLRTVPTQVEPQQFRVPHDSKRAIRGAVHDVAKKHRLVINPDDALIGLQHIFSAVQAEPQYIPVLTEAFAVRFARDPLRYTFYAAEIRATLDALNALQADYGVRTRKERECFYNANWVLYTKLLDHPAGILLATQVREDLRALQGRSPGAVAAGIDRVVEKYGK